MWEEASESVTTLHHEESSSQKHVASQAGMPSSLRYQNASDTGKG